MDLTPPATDLSDLLQLQQDSILGTHFLEEKGAGEHGPCKRDPNRMKTFME